MVRILLLCLGLLSVWPQAVLAQARHDHGGGGGMPALPKVKPCPEASLACAISATPFFAPDGSLYLAWSSGGRIVVARSIDQGRTFADPVFANPGEENVDAGPDSRPSIVVDAAGRITVAYAIFKDRGWNGEVRLTQAAAGGAFAPPVAIAENPASQRFQALFAGRDGRILAVWLDKRARLQLPNPRDYAGAALAWTWLTPGNAPDGTAHTGRDNTCECCRLGVAAGPDGNPVVLFRDIFPGSVRDHAVIAFSDQGVPGPTRRVSDDDWVIAACPHHGPSLAIDASGGWHVAWYTQGSRRAGTFYAHSYDQGQTFSAPMAVGSADEQAGRSSLLAIGDTVYLAWKQFDGEQSVVNLMVSRNRGERFSAPSTIARTSDASDHPLLIANGTKPYLSWLTTVEGYRLVPLEVSE